MTTILVIEDEDPIRTNIIEMLELEGYDALEAADGQAGIEQATQHVPDLIICDITMPELDGYEVLMALRETSHTASIPFIFLTARADRSFMRHGMELGADDYLTKPFTLTELRAAIHTRLDRHEAITASAGPDLEEARRMLVQMVAHELRTPLVSITTATEIISRQLGHMKPGQLGELLEAVQRGGQRLGRVVEQIVLIVQLESGSLSQSAMRANGMPVRVSDVLIGARDLARTFAYREPDVTLRLEERDAGVEVRGEMRALRHALAELICNALSFSPPGGEVTVAQWVAEGSVWLSIVDHGPGIPPEKLERAMSDFLQIDRAVQEQQGIGLGLPLACRVIEAHGGTFKLDSVVGRGTQITLSLPVWRES